MKIFRHLKGLTVATFALAIGLAAFAFGSTEVHADDTTPAAVTTTPAAVTTTPAGVTAITPTYDPETDTVKVQVEYQEYQEDLKIYVGDTKSADKVVGKKIKTVGLSVPTSGVVTISLSDSKNGVKVAQNKNAFLYISGTQPAAGTEYEPQFKIAATDVKKIDSVAFDYYKANSGVSETAITVKYTPTEGDAVTADLAKVQISDIVDKKEKETFAGTELTGGKLYTICSEKTQVKGKDKAVKHKFNVFILGKATSVTVADVTYDAQRSSKPKSVGVGSEANAKAVKVDYLKGTIAIKNGCDYTVRAALVSESAIQLSELKTVLPKKAGGIEGSTMDTAAYIPQATIGDDNKQYFTETAVKSLSLATICASVWEDSETAYINVRTSASAKKPASAFYTDIAVKKPANQPVITVSGTAINATVNKDKLTVKLGNANITGAAASAGYEIVAVKEADLNNIDLNTLKWQKFDPSKDLKINSIKTKIDKDTTVTVYDKDAKELASGVIVLVRGAGVKENAKKNIVGLLPTEYTKTKFVKVGDTIEWQVVSSGSSTPATDP